MKCSPGISNFLKEISSLSHYIVFLYFFALITEEGFLISNTLATWCKEMTHLKISWCWERLKVGGEGDDRRWAGWMASPTQWTWVWVNSRRWWWTGRPRVPQSVGSQRVGHNWQTELNWTELRGRACLGLYRTHMSLQNHPRWLCMIQIHHRLLLRK